MTIYGLPTPLPKPAGSAKGPFPKTATVVTEEGAAFGMIIRAICCATFLLSKFASKHNARTIWTCSRFTTHKSAENAFLPKSWMPYDLHAVCSEKEDVLSKINAMSITSCCRDLAAVQMQTLPVMCQPPFGSDNVAGSLEADPIEGPPSETMLHPDSSVLNGNPILDALRQNLAGPITQPGSSGAQVC